MEFLVLNANRYNFKPQDAKEGAANISGLNLHVIEIGGESNKNQDFKGPEVLKVACAESAWPKLTAIPGVYSAQVAIRRGKDNQASIKIQDVELVTAVDLGQKDPKK
jgi:hypothetical protein